MFQFRPLIRLRRRLLNIISPFAAHFQINLLCSSNRRLRPPRREPAAAKKKATRWLLSNKSLEARSIDTQKSNSPSPRSVRFISSFFLAGKLYTLSLVASLGRNLFCVVGGGGEEGERRQKSVKTHDQWKGGGWCGGVGWCRDKILSTKEREMTYSCGLRFSSASFSVLSFYVTQTRIELSMRMKELSTWNKSISFVGNSRHWDRCRPHKRELKGKRKSFRKKSFRGAPLRRWQGQTANAKNRSTFRLPRFNDDGKINFQVFVVIPSTAFHPFPPHSHMALKIVWAGDLKYRFNNKWWKSNSTQSGGEDIKGTENGNNTSTHIPSSFMPVAKPKFSIEKCF